MGKTTIYLNKEAEEIYRTAKEYAGDNLSAVIVQGLKLYVEKMDMMTKRMEEIILFIGETDLMEQFTKGKNIKFTGMHLAKETAPDIYGDGLTCTYTIFLTRKGNFLIYKDVINQKEYIQTDSYKVFEKFSDVMEAGYPYKLLDEARQKIPEVACEELDI